MIKVLHVITRFDMGGAERIAMNIAKSKSRNCQYHMIEVIRGNSEFTEDMLNELSSQGISFHRSVFTSSKFAIIFFPITLVFKCLKLKPDILHSHTEIPDLGIYLFSIINFFHPKVRYIRTIHNTQLWGSWEGIGRKVEKLFIKHKSNIAISLATKAKYEEVYKQKDLPIVFNGISKGKEKKFPFLLVDKINVLFAGRFEHQKGINELCEIIELLEKNPIYHFYIIGDGSLQKYINRRLKSRKNVSIYPKMYNLSDYFSSFQYLFMPSNFEGLATISIEASLCKTPVIANAAPGLEETLPPDWVLKVRNNSIEEYLHLFNSVIPSIDRNFLGKKAYDYVQIYFSIRRMQEEYENAYKKILEKSYE